MTPQEYNRRLRDAVDAMPFAPRPLDWAQVWCPTVSWEVDREAAHYFDHLYCQELGIQYP